MKGKSPKKETKKPKKTVKKSVMYMATGGRMN